MTTLPGINLYSTPISNANGNIHRIKRPVHHGSNLSVAVGYINGRAWAKCWSHGCAQADILAALGIANTGSIRWTPPPPPPPRPTTSIAQLPAVSHTQALDYLSGIKTPKGATVYYQRNDGRRGKHWRNLDKRRNPNVTSDGWQLRRFDPVDPSSATALCLTEGEKDAAQLSAAGLIAFTAPRGAQSLPGADFTELVALAKETHLPILLIGDNDEVGRKAMRQVRRQLQPVGVPEPLPYPITGWKRTKNHSHLDVTDLTGRAPEKGSIADLPQPELHKLLGLLLQDLDERMVKPVRSRMMYREYWCPVARMMIAGRSILCTWCFLSSLRVDFHSTCRSSRSSRSYCQESRGLGPIQYVLPPYFRSVFSGAGGSENPRRGSAGILGCLLQCS